MRVTNKYNLPQAVVDAVQRHDHRKGNFSVTQLLKGSTEIALEMMNSDKLEMDVSDMFNMLLGTAVHKVLEEQQRDGVLNEHYMETTVFAGMTVSGCADYIDTTIKEIGDYKSCSAWKVIFKDYDDWREQTKSYLYLWYVETGELWHDARVTAIIKDFSQTDAERKPDYPKKPIVSIPFHFTDAEIFGVAERWEEKIVEVLQKLVSQDFGCCSEKERWAKPPKFALMKEGRISAVKLYDSQEECKKAVEENGKGFYMESRSGEDTKCDRYCVVGKCGFCPYRNAKEAT